MSSGYLPLPFLRLTAGKAARAAALAALAAHAHSLRARRSRRAPCRPCSLRAQPPSKPPAPPVLPHFPPSRSAAGRAARAAGLAALAAFALSRRACRPRRRPCRPCRPCAKPSGTSPAAPTVPPSLPPNTPPPVTSPTPAATPPNFVFAHLAIAPPDSCIAARPQHIDEHDDTRTRRIISRRLPQTRHGVNRSRGAHPLVTTGPIHDDLLVAVVAKPRQSWHHTAPTRVSPARAARRAAANTDPNPGDCTRTRTHAPACVQPSVRACLRVSVDPTPSASRRPPTHACAWSRGRGRHRQTGTPPIGTDRRPSTTLAARAVTPARAPKSPRTPNRVSPFLDLTGKVRS